VAHLPDGTVGFEPPPVPFLCPVCRVANAVLAYEDHWKRVFQCLQCRHLWHTALTPNSPAALKSKSLE
jgi:hypothetical protein